MGNENSFNYAMRKLVLKSLSVSIPLIMLDAPFWVIPIVTAVVFVSALCGSVVIAYAYRFLHNIIIRPGLYIWALIVTISGEQDFVAIAFYIVFALQLKNIILSFVCEIYTIVNRPRDN
jgi:hypothetical protein